jgi:hypothetical protein
MARKKYDVDADEFCRVWQLASSADQASRELNMPKPIVLARASFYRKKGVRLKKFPRHKVRLNIGDLNEMLGKLPGGSTSPESSKGKPKARRRAGEDERHD